MKQNLNYFSRYKNVANTKKIIPDQHNRKKQRRWHESHTPCPKTMNQYTVGLYTSSKPGNLSSAAPLNKKNKIHGFISLLLLALPAYPIS
jgi:hypothetical protein